MNMYKKIILIETLYFLIPKWHAVDFYAQTFYIANPCTVQGALNTTAHMLLYALLLYLKT